MKLLIIFLFSSLLIFQHSKAQLVYYAAAKAGLSMREQPGVNAKVLEKIAYGQKLEVLKGEDNLQPIATEGFSGSWWKVKCNNKVGYIVSSYLLTSVPPKGGVNNLTNYFKQLSSPAGGPVVIGSLEDKSLEEGGGQLKKQLYKNGMEWHEAQGYEYNSALYILPGYTIEQAYLLLRLLNQFPELIGDNEPFPVKNLITTNQAAEKKIEVERENYDDGKLGPVKKIKITHSEGAVTEFEIFTIDTQVLVSYNSGV